jgi:CTP:molybdopterin cytidylyltransferase MocA
MVAEGSVLMGAPIVAHPFGSIRPSLPVCYDPAVTVAAVVLAARAETALADADGLPAVRRIAETAWSGGAIPVVVVSFDPDSTVITALLGTEASLVEPAPVAGGPVGQICTGIDAALRLVGETDAALVWPARLTWPDPETITSLIEAHGTDPSAVLRPRFDDEAGWPVLVPVAALEQRLAHPYTRPRRPGNGPGRLGAPRGAPGLSGPERAGQRPRPRMGRRDRGRRPRGLTVVTRRPAGDLAAISSS